MYTEPEDQVPRNQPTPQGGRRGRRLAAILIPAVIMLIVGFTIGHATSSHGTTPVAIITPPAPVLTTASPTIEDPTSPSASPSLTASASASPTGTATDTTSATASSTSAAGTVQALYLSQATPVDNGDALNSPVDATISNQDYPNSVQQDAEGSNGTNTVWDVAQYTTFTAEVGIDDSQSADGQTARIVFFNQSSVQLGSVEVSIGSPKLVKIPLNGAVHFDINCIAEGTGGGYLVTFGNAQFLP
jgi:hypothetical protein